MAEEGGDEMKDVTITSFGLVIAYLLPGLVGLYGLSFWSPALQKVFGTFLTLQSNVGLFLIVLLAALIVGLLANGFRYFIFEVLFFKSYRMDQSLLKYLPGERKLSAYRTAIDETYRYHQWWGGLAVVTPIGCIGWIVAVGPYHLRTGLFAIGFIAIEWFCVLVALRIWAQTVKRLEFILKGEADMGGNPGPGR